jgi:hypothetical protein
MYIIAGARYKTQEPDKFRLYNLYPGVGTHGSSFFLYVVSYAESIGLQDEWWYVRASRTVCPSLRSRTSRRDLPRRRSCRRGQGRGL